MPGLDRQLVEHRLPMIPGATQAPRRMTPELTEKVKEATLESKIHSAPYRYRYRLGMLNGFRTTDSSGNK